MALDETFPRDYSLTGPLNARAQQIGLANAEWYKTPIPRARMKDLMQRSDDPATRDTIIYYGLMLLTGGFGAYFWGTWFAVPFFIIYGVLYASGGDSRWHECGHGTAFKTAWKNEFVYQVACFMVLRNPAVWKWSHARHHTDTIIVGRDPEIILMRPPEMIEAVLNIFQLVAVPKALWAMLRHATGNLTAAEKDFIPASEQGKVAIVARVWTAIFAVVIGLSVNTHSLLPLMLVGLPSLYGSWHVYMTGLTQHIGLAEDVLDHRLNCRTIYINPFSRFVYWNMNYHVEHHMFPLVPYHRLPELHAEVKSDCPPPYRSFWHAYSEIIPTLLRQLRDPTYFVRRQLPPGAGPAKLGPLLQAAE